jgi:hypothetical protein
LPTAHFVAAACLVLLIPLLGRWKLHTGAAFDLTPSLHWPAPVLSGEVEDDRGPLRIIVQYQYKVELDDRDIFLAAIRELRGERLRDGAYDWDIFEDAAEAGRMIETFLVQLRVWGGEDMPCSSQRPAAETRVDPRDAAESAGLRRVQYATGHSTQKIRKRVQLWLACHQP